MMMMCIVVVILGIIITIVVVVVMIMIMTVTIGNGEEGISQKEGKDVQSPERGTTRERSDGNVSCRVGVGGIGIGRARRHRVRVVGSWSLIVVDRCCGGRR